MNLGDIGRAMVGLAALLAVIGGLLMLGGRAGVGRLPGDLSFGGNGLRVYIPLATCVLLSIIATVVLNLWARR